VLTGLQTAGATPARTEAAEPAERECVENANATGLSLAYGSYHEKFSIDLQNLTQFACVLLTFLPAGVQLGSRL
jgi:hypothetical protein